MTTHYQLGFIVGFILTIWNVNDELISLLKEEKLSFILTIWNVNL
ncbi:Uncharacterised protein [Clostridioides difficile]|nr:Uncharacterised protein [Clostridioides difficile]